MGIKGAKIYDYLYALDYALCHGRLDSLNYVWVKDKRVFCGMATSRRDICVNLPNLFGGDKAEGGVVGVIEYHPGDDPAVVSESMAARMELPVPEAPAYQGISHLFFRKPGTLRGGFKWGTNTPYLPPIKASVTRIPRGLGNKYSKIRPLDAVFAEGQIPDLQDPDKYPPKMVTDDSEWNENRKGLQIAVWNNGPVIARLPTYWIDSTPIDVLVEDIAGGECDISFERTGSITSQFITQFTSSGKPVRVDEKDMLTAIDSGLAQVHVQLETRLGGIGLIGTIDLTGGHYVIIRQYSGKIDPYSGLMVPDQIIQQDFNIARNFGVDVKYPVAPRARFTQIAIASYASWIYNSVTIDKQEVSIVWPDIEYEHCSLEDNLGELPDANPAHIAYEVLIDEEERDSAAMAAYIDAASFEACAKTLFNEGFGMSMRQDQAIDRKAFLAKLCDHVRGAIYQHPQTGRWTMKLFRDDYIVANLPILTKADLRMKSGNRRAWSECISEITVDFTNPNSEESSTVSAHNDSASAITGSRRAEVRSYEWIRNFALAQIVAARDVTEASYPLWTGEVYVSREYWKLAPGDLFVMNYVDEDYQIDSMVVRVMGVDYQSLSDREILVNVSEDIFSVGSTEYTGTQKPITPPSAPYFVGPPEFSFGFGLPYGLAERYKAEGVNLDEHDSIWALAYASQTTLLNGVEVNFHNHDNNTLKPIVEIPPCRVATMPNPLLAEVYSRVPIKLLVEISPDELYPGKIFAITNRTPTQAISEFVEMHQYVPAEKAWIIKRGVFDTVPRAWSGGQLIWDIEPALDTAFPTPQYDHGTIYGRTLSGALSTPDSSLWEVSIPYDEGDRVIRPTRPANVKVNGVGPGAFVDPELTSPITDLTISWSTRNRLIEEATTPAWDEDDFFAEAGETYTVRFRDPDDLTKIRYEQTGIPASPVYVPISALAPRGLVFVEVYAVSSTGKESFMSSKNYVLVDKVALDYQGWNYQYGRNWSGTNIT